ncbi:MAG TPA: ATP-binding protein [Bdellovibrionota bacterium]|nr:ATP-binding protein [Bdellovibrionota bacterium]
MTFVILILLLLSLVPVAFKGMDFFRSDKEKSLQDFNAQTVGVQAREIAKALQSRQRSLTVMAFAGGGDNLRPVFEAQFQHDYWVGTFTLAGSALQPGKILRPKSNESGESPEKIAADPNVMRRLEKLPVGEIRLMRRIPESGRPSVLFATRLNNNVFGMTLGPPESLYDYRSKTKIYSVYLIDANGDLIFHSDAASLPKGVSYKFHPLVALLGRTGVDIGGATANYRDPAANEKVIGAFAPLGLADAGLVVQIPKKAAFAAAGDLISRFMFMILLIFTGAVAIGLVFAASLTRPIRKLAGMTSKIGKGEFEVNVTISSKDEIGDLTRAFNQMGTELKERDARLEHAKKQLIQSEKMSAFGQMSAGIAHEVKNPLAGILGYAQLAKKKATPESGMDKYLDIIEKETKRCKDIVENLMRFARQEKTEFLDFDVNQAVRDSVALVDHQVTISGIKIERNFCPDGTIAPVFGNANQIQQVLTNLMLNAQQAMKEAGTLTVSTRKGENGWAEILVADTGMGIPKENLEKIFEPFFTTKPAGQGTGLGLAVTFGIIRSHNGEIKVGSEVGKGTTFTVRLPTKEAPAKDG